MTDFEIKEIVDPPGFVGVNYDHTAWRNSKYPRKSNITNPKYPNPIQGKKERERRLSQIAGLSDTTE